jgi:hypothetical protein
MDCRHHSTDSACNTITETSPTHAESSQDDMNFEKANCHSMPISYRANRQTLRADTVGHLLLTLWIFSSRRH